jgi:hypothetical protein
LKPLAASILILTFFWQSLFQSAFLGYWKFNQGEIIATKCINRFKPMMHCNGKCYLYRQLKKAAEAEAQNNKIPEAVLKLKTIDYCILAEPFWQWTPFQVLIINRAFNYPNTLVSAGYTTSLFKPPAATA